MFIPRKINVGFQERSDTYSGKLAYVIYYDEKNKLRKEGSWNSWRDSKIPNEEFNNEPTGGFVLNRKAGGGRWGWNPRQTYVRVYDPRGWEFELTVPNLLFLLENTNSIKGKGLEGEFVYAWEGKDLVLLPVDSIEYKEFKIQSDIFFDRPTVKASELKEGHTYLNKSGERYTYLGKHFNHSSNKNVFWFAHHYASTIYLTTKTSVTIFLVLEDTSFDGKHPDYLDMLELMQHNEEFSPIDESKCIVEPLSFEVVEAELNKSYSINFPYKEYKDIVCSVNKKSREIFMSNWGSIKYSKEVLTFEEFYDRYKPYRKHLYLQNGNYLDTLEVGHIWVSSQEFKKIKKGPK